MRWTSALHIESRGTGSVQHVVEAWIAASGTERFLGAEPLTEDEFIDSSRIKCSMGFKNGRIVSNPFIRVLRLRAAESRICSGR
jgi:hypothetical protein